jgi:spore germination cell wall hydrolase CwlJ-like protein
MNIRALALYGAAGGLLYLAWSAVQASAATDGQTTATAGQGGMFAWLDNWIDPGASEAMTDTTGDSNDVMTLARTIYGEARGEGAAGMAAVASVVMNRVRAGNYPGGTSVARVCTAPWQFSCWNPGDPNLAVIRAVTAANPVFADALAIARQAVAGQLADTTGGATMYHDTSIATPAKWGAVQQTASIGRLEFFT